MKDIRETITEAIENSQIDHIVTQQSADELIEELLAALEKEYNTPQETIDRYYRIVDEIQLNQNFKVLIRQDQETPFGRWYYQIQCHRIDVITGIWGEGFSGKAYLTPHASENELVQTIFGLYKGYWEHESRESFEWKGRRVFGPHIATQALWDVARRVDIRSAKHEDDTLTREEVEEANLAALRQKLNGPSPMEQEKLILDDYREYVRTANAMAATRMTLQQYKEARREAIPADQVQRPKTNYAPKDIVSWSGDKLDTKIVRGTVIDVDAEKESIRVFWSDGSGLTWHSMSEMQKL